jgi:hypothetical protein
MGVGCPVSADCLPSSRSASSHSLRINLPHTPVNREEERTRQPPAASMLEAMTRKEGANA